MIGGRETHGGGARPPIPDCRLKFNYDSLRKLAEADPGGSVYGGGDEEVGDTVALDECELGVNREHGAGEGSTDRDFYNLTIWLNGSHLNFSET